MAYETLSVSPKSIRFTQNSISENFGDRGNGTQETIEDTFKQLLYGDISVDSVRDLTVVRKDGNLWVISGNRRLYVYKKLEQYGRMSKIQVNVRPINVQRFSTMYTTKNNGVSVYIRQDKRRGFGDKMENRLVRIYTRWISDGRPTDGQPKARALAYAGDSFRTSAYVPSTRAETPPPSRPPPTLRTYPAPSQTPSRTSSQFEYPSYHSREIPHTSPPPPKSEKSDSWCTIL